jgi:hypothetical protein
MLSMNELRNLGPNDVLQLIGLQKRRDTLGWLLPAAGVFGAGLLLGAGFGLMLAPSSGKQLRSRVRDQLHRGAPEPEKGRAQNGATATAARVPDLRDHSS